MTEKPTACNPRALVFFYFVDVGAMGVILCAACDFALAGTISEREAASGDPD
jgi:hypothetical protein